MQLLENSLVHSLSTAQFAKKQPQLPSPHPSQRRNFPTVKAGLCSSNAQTSTRPNSRVVAAQATTQSEAPAAEAAAKAWRVGRHSLQGLREEMEDHHTVIHDVPGGFLYAAVFDGHCGSATAKFLE